MTKNDEVREFAASHGGVVPASELERLGITPNQIRSKVRRHGWVSLGRGAYRLFPARDHRDNLLAAVTVLERAVVSHESAAEIHGFSRLPKGKAIVTVHSRTTHKFRFDEVLAHRTHDLDPSHVTVVGALPVTTVERTVVDLAAPRHPKHIGAIVDDLVSRGLLDFSMLMQIAESVARKGKPGTVTMRTVIEERGGAMRAQSELERRARALIESAGLPQPIHEFAIPWAPERRFDDAYPHAKLAIEWDSRRYHGQLEAFEADRRRDRAAAIHGWRVVRFTWEDLEVRPREVIDSIRLLLARAS
jgi:predicted transcriptional regulator of viral defense system